MLKGKASNQIEEIKARLESQLLEDLQKKDLRALERSNLPVELTAWRSALYFRIFPFFTAKAGKVLTPIEYVSPDGKFQITASPNVRFGLPTVWDADVWDFILTKAREVMDADGDFPSQIRFSVTECLKSLQKHPEGKNHKRIIEAVNRLCSTVYICNFLAKKREKGFCLASWEFISKNQRDTLVEITFHTDVVEGLRSRKNPLISTAPEIKQMLLEEENSGLRKQILRIISARIYNKKNLTLLQETLMSLCQSTEPKTEFRRRLKRLILPWNVEIIKESKHWKIVFSAP